MSCWVFQLGQSPLIFLLWDTLSVWDSHVEDSIWSRRTGKSPLPELGGYISSAVAAGRWQLGPSSRYQRAKWSLELCCRWSPRSGLLGNLGSSQRHLVDFTQIVESWRRCWLFGAWDFWLWQLPGFCRTYPILAGVQSFSTVSIWTKPQRQVSVLLSAPLYLSRAFCQDVTAWLTFPQGMPVQRNTQRMVFLRCLSQVFTWEMGRAGLMEIHPQPSQIDKGTKSWSKEGGLLEQMQIWANNLFQ